MSNEYRVVTICNKFPIEPYYCLTEWRASLMDVIPLVLGTKPGEYGGLGSKPRLLYHAIKNGQIPEKHIVFTDCFDFVFAAHPNELFEAYKNFNAPVVISAERNCFPPDTKDAYDKLAEKELPTPYKYLNSGLIVAETEAMLTVLEDIDAPNIPNDYWDEEKGCRINPNDQEYYQHSFLRQPVKMELDRFQILCGTLHETTPDELDFSGERIRRKDINTYPLSWHMNGSGKTSGCREVILKHLNLI